MNTASVSFPWARSFSPGDLILGVATVAWLLVTAFYCARDVDPFYGLLVALASTVVTPLWLIVPVWALVVAVRRLRSQAYVAAGLAALIPLVALAVPDYGPSLGVFLRFYLERPGYVARIEAARAGRDDPDIVTGASVVAFFPWSGSATGTYGVVYDEFDVIGKPIAMRQELWRYRPVPGELLCDGKVRPLGNHFYMAGFIC